MNVDEPNEPEGEQEPESELRSADEPTPEAPQQPQDELRSAFTHFKNAAGMLLDKAVNEGTLERAAAEAERALGQFTSTAEPLAKQLTSEIAKVGRIVGQTLTEAIQAQTRPLEPVEDEGVAAAEPTGESERLEGGVNQPAADALPADDADTEDHGGAPSADDPTDTP